MEYGKVDPMHGTPSVNTFQPKNVELCENETVFYKKKILN
jgi:hypothetical protein